MRVVYEKTPVKEVHFNNPQTGKKLRMRKTVDGIFLDVMSESENHVTESKFYPDVWVHDFIRAYHILNNKEQPNSDDTLEYQWVFNVRT